MTQWFDFTANLASLIKKKTDPKLTAIHDFFHQKCCFSGKIWKSIAESKNRSADSKRRGVKIWVKRRKFEHFFLS